MKWDVDAWNDERKNAKDPSQPFVLANGGAVLFPRPRPDRTNG